MRSSTACPACCARSASRRCLWEPIQGTNAAREASIPFYERALALCHEHGTLCVFDETLTGLYRTGTAFHADRMGAAPDILLFAKSMGNGFPVSALALAQHIEVRSQCLPGSTFSGNALALAAIEATLVTMAALPMAQHVAAIEATVRAALGGLHDAGAILRGRGALWCLEMRDALSFEQAHAAIADAGLLVTCADRCIRLLPAAHDRAAGAS